MNDVGSEWSNEWMKYGVSEVMSGWVKYGVSEVWSEWGREWMKYGVSEVMSELGMEWMREVGWNIIREEPNCFYNSIIYILDYTIDMRCLTSLDPPPTDNPDHTDNPASYR